MKPSHTLRHGALLAACLLVPGRAEAGFLSALSGIANFGLPLAQNIVSMIPGAGVALPFLQGAQTIANGGIGQGVSQIVGSAIAQGQQQQMMQGLPQGFSGGMPVSYNGASPTSLAGPSATSLAGPAGGTGSAFPALAANLPPALGGTGSPWLPGNAAMAEVDKLRDQVDDLTGLVEDLRDELAKARDGKTSGDDEATSKTTAKVLDDDTEETEPKDDGVPGEDSMVVK